MFSITQSCSRLILQSFKCIFLNIDRLSLLNHLLMTSGYFDVLIFFLLCFTLEIFKVLAPVSCFLLQFFPLPHPDAKISLNTLALEHSHTHEHTHICTTESPLSLSLSLYPTGNILSPSHSIQTLFNSQGQQGMKRLSESIIRS